MDQHRWKKTKEIFNAALEVPVGEREQFVRTASDGDCELESEILRLLLADKDAGSYLESPLIPGTLLRQLASPPLLRAGDVLCERFRIDRLIGEGGMGHVFEAWDTVLRVRIALKVIRPEIAGDPASLARFRQEVLTARSISHQNVCRTFDIDVGPDVVNPLTGASQNVIFLTMEFLEGETLADRIARTGAFASHEALVIARQIASALCCAHDHGIVHGDIKPANVMLVRRGGATSDVEHAPSRDLRVVITDFGLARIDRAVRTFEFSAATSSILPGGTLAYMAPEQLKGSAISSATDIYAFGLILFEMAAGQRVFSSSNLLAGIAQRLIEPAALTPTLVSMLPAPWHNAIEGCLHSKPSDRFKNAADVISALEGGRAGLLPAKRTRLSRWFATLERPVWRRLSAATGIFAIAVALLAGGLRLYQSRTDSKVAPGALVYLPQVTNHTGEKSFDNLTELIQAGIAQSGQVNLLDQGRVGDILQQMTKSPDTTIDPTTARDIAMRAGAVRVVFTDLIGLKDGYGLNVEIQQPDNTPLRYRNHWTKQFTWRMPTDSSTIPPELLTAVRAASDWIRNETGESGSDIARLDVPPEDVTTNDWRALAAFTKAEILSAQGKKENALVALEDAVRIDPEFALAYARMGDLDVSLGRTQDSFRAYNLALNTDFDRRLTRRELDRIRGIYASDNWDYQAAESAFRDYTVYYEHDYLGWFYRALPLMRLGRTQEAIATLQKAFAIDPRRGSAPYDLAICYMEIGDMGSAQQWIEVLRQLHDLDSVAILEGTVDFLKGHYDDAEGKFASVRFSPVPEYRLKALSFLVRLTAERKNYSRSLVWIQEGITEAARQGNDGQQAAFLMDRARVHYLLEEYAACAQDLRESLSKDQSPELLISASRLYGQVIGKTSGSTAATFRADLVGLVRQIPAGSSSLAYAVALQYIRTETLVANGNWEDGLKEARRTSTLDQQFTRRDYLARALALAARNEPAPQKRQLLLTEARAAYASSALHPISVWAQPTMYAPGVLAEDVAAYIEISRELKANDEALFQSQQLYKALRPETR